MMVLVTKVLVEHLKIKTSTFRKISAFVLQNVLTALGWVIIVTNPRTYMLGACVYCVFHVMEDLFFVKSYLRQKTSIVITNTFLAWAFWPHYNAFSVFCRIYSPDLNTVLNSTVAKGSSSGTDEQG